MPMPAAFTAEPHQNFPRGQLQYVKELGSGWFGKVGAVSSLGDRLEWDGISMARKISSTVLEVPVNFL